MISDLWTLHPDGQPGLSKPLPAMGVVSASLTRRNQAAATLSLAIERSDALTAAPIAGWESRWILRRGGDVAFRGRVASVPRAGAAEEETLSVELRDLWWDLERTPYLQAWDTLTATGVGQARIPRALLGVDSASSRETTAQSLARIRTAAVSAGAPFVLDAQLPALVCPPIEAANQSCADLIRAVLRYHPGAMATVVSDSGQDVLLIRDRSTATARSAPATGKPVVGLDIRERPDLAVDSVQVHYETEATHWTEMPADPGDTPGLRARRRLAIFSDVYPPGQPATRKSMVVTLPATPISDPPPPPLPHRVPIKTRPLPPSGSRDDEAEKWWLDILELTALGLTKDDVVLPPPDSEAAQPHRVRFAWQVDDPGDPLQGAPSAINPNSTVLWRPPRVEDLPRMLVSGLLSEWMRVEAAEVVVDATVGVRKSAVDAMGPAEKEIFMRLGPVLKPVGGIDAYRIYRAVKVTATTAKTRVYEDWTASATYNPAADLAASVAAARERSVIPDLARKLYEERRTAPWEGALTILEEEAGGVRWIGHVLNLSGGRAEWAAMRAVIQSESLDIGRGTTQVDFGPPEHLSPQDHAELWMVDRRARTSRAEAAQTSPPPPTQEPGEDDFGSPGTGGVFPPTVGPKVELLHPGGGGGSSSRIWDVEVVDAEAGTVRIIEPGRVRIAADWSSDANASIADLETEHSLSVGQFLAIEISIDGSMRIVAIADWTDSPWPWATVVDENGYKVMEQGYFPLWKAIAPPTVSTPRRHLEVSSSLTLERLVPDLDLELHESLEQHPAGVWVSTPVLSPAFSSPSS